MYYGTIKNFDIANGEGVRVSLFVSGCTHHCKGCFNQDTWNFWYGQPYTQETDDTIINMLSDENVYGLSLLGGEPFEPANQRELVKLLRRVRAELPNKNVWCYTGYLYEDLQKDSRAKCEVTEEMLKLIDVLVDGEFVEDLKDISLSFRGSANQRIIDMKQTNSTGAVVLYALRSN